MLVRWRLCYSVLTHSKTVSGVLVRWSSALPKIISPRPSLRRALLSLAMGLQGPRGVGPSSRR